MISGFSVNSFANEITDDDRHRVKLHADNPRDQEMIEKFQRAYEKIRKIVDRLEGVVNRRMRKQLEEFYGEEGGRIKRALQTIFMRQRNTMAMVP